MSVRHRLVSSLPDSLVRAVIHRAYPFQEPELRLLDDYLPSTRCAVDVGTWWGPWTAAMAKKCPSVHSFEPQPELAAKLRTWLPSNVTLHEVGVGLSTGTATLTRPDHNVGTDGLATLRPDPSDIRGETIQVDVVSIDDCDLHDVGFIKVDVEGLELDALRGAEKTIRRDQPRLMVEIEQRHLDYPMTDVFDWLTEHGYQGWFLRAGEQQRAYSWVPLDDFDIDHDQTQQLGQLKSAQYINAFLFVSKDDAWNPPSARRG